MEPINELTQNVKKRRKTIPTKNDDGSTPGGQEHSALLNSAMSRAVITDDAAADKERLRKEKNRLRVAKSRALTKANETPQERINRLAAQNALAAARFRSETQDDRLRRLHAIKTQRQAKRSAETPQERRVRLDAKNAYNSEHRRGEAPEARQRRLDAMKARNAIARSQEEHEERQQRLHALKVFSATQRTKETSDDRRRRLEFFKANRMALSISEPNEKRVQRIQQRREANHCFRNVALKNKLLLESECKGLDEAGLLQECSKELKNELLSELSFALGPSGLDQCVCCVCDRLVFKTNVQVFSTEDKTILQSMAARLRNPEVNLSDKLLAFYDCKDVHPAFVDLLLSRKGMMYSGNNDLTNPEDVEFNLCLDCEGVLLQPWSSQVPRCYLYPNEVINDEHGLDNPFDEDEVEVDANEDGFDDDGPCNEDNDLMPGVEFPDFSKIPVESWPLPPKFAIANHFFVGELPEDLFKATWAEMLMCSLVSVVAQTRVIRGGKHRMIRSHLILFDAVPGPPATLLPLKLNRDAMYRVVLAGPFTKDQLIKVKEYHLVRQAMVLDMLHFYKSNNAFYADVSIDGDLIASLPEEDVPDGIIDEALGMDDKASAVDNEQAAVNGFSGDPDEGSCEHECAYVERSVLFTQTTTDMEPATEKKVLESLRNKIHQRTPPADVNVPEFNVHTSSKLSNYFEDGIDARMFPHLFPFGRGFTNERGRRVPVSKLQCCRLYCSLSSRRFAQDRYFVMVSFDRFGLDRGFINSNFSTKARPSMHTPVAKISHDDMRKGLENQDSRRFGRTPKNKFVNKAVDVLLRSVECSSSFVWGSNAERRMHRREAFATADRFGQPSLFVTITPNVDGTITLAYLAGGIKVKSLFDVQYLKHMPDKATMQQLALNDNMASATLFDRSAEAFTNIVLGFDKTMGRPRKSGGLFGHVKAYFGMVETQGRGTLHLHLLAWVYGAPRSTSEFEARLQADPHYESMVLKYSEAIVSNSLPLDLLKTPCQTCEHVDVEYEALKPPVSAFEKPSRKEGAIPREPLMAKCSHCDAKVSSQHLIRQALLNSRPNLWPVELPKLPQSAVDKYLDEEASYLKAAGGKKYDPTRAHDHARASFKEYLAQTAHLESKDSYIKILAGARVKLEECNTTSNTYVAPDKDPFCLDHVYRELASMPFGPNETRLPDDMVLFVVATLASVLQVHWWSHCSSCFKQSRNTRAANLCRYLFPRERVEAGHIGTSAIMLVRKLGEEYINGYSDVILRAFKCNHDIQIMIGGAEMAERIYYACKYTTKDQQKVECRTALALAAFDTRVQREASAAQGGEVLSDEVKCRRRLASHMFNMTRKQEVAGPLCALYLLRESCAYTSHLYKKMSIRHVLKFLHQHSDTAFQLELIDNFSKHGSSRRSLGGSNESNPSSSDEDLDGSSSFVEESDDENEPSCNVESRHLEDESVFVPVGPAEDYINRPDALCKNLSWYEYTSKYFRGDRTSRTLSERLFVEQHSLYNSKCLGVHRLQRIPVLSGGVRVPYLGDCLKSEQQDYHAQVALVLFKPFRALSDLCPNGISWHKAWEDFEPMMSPFCAQVYHFMQDYHVGRKKAAKTRTSREEEQNIQEEHDDGLDDVDDFDDIDVENALRIANRDATSKHLDPEVTQDVYAEVYQSGSSSEMSNSVKFPTTTPIDADIQALIGGKSLEEAARVTSTKYTSIVGTWDQRLRCREQFASDINGLKSWGSKKPIEKAVTFEVQSRVDECDGSTTSWSTDTPIPTLVHLNVASALEPSTMLYAGTHVERGKLPQALPDFARIGVVSSAFGLRMRQHLAFMCIARALLQRWQLEENGDHDPESVVNATSSIQLRMVLHGEGGTGKSHIIAAVQAFCNSWKRHLSIAKTAMTGKAAVSINGVTLHSWIGMHNLTPSTVHEAREAEEKGVPGYTDDLKLLLVDEMSMMNKQHLVRLDEALRGRTKLDLPFGGINIVLAGDFFQMPPVGGKPLYTPLSAFRDNAKFDMYEDAGLTLWRSFTDVVVLNESVRFAQDPEWGRYVSMARKGHWCSELVDILNSRILSDGLALKSMASQGSTIPPAPSKTRCTTYTTPDNRTRQAIINAYTAALSKKLPRNHYPIRIVANFNGQLNGLSLKDISDVMSLPDTKLGNMAPFIDLVPGMPVVFTQNVNPRHGIANGTFGTLHSVQFDPSTKFKLVEDSGSKLKVLIPSSPPQVVFVRVTRPANFDVLPRDDLHDSLPEDVYPVFMFKPQGSAVVSLTPGPGGKKRSVKLNLKQLPFVNAIASTIYKIQGETMESLVVADWKAHGSNTNKVVNTRQQGYIAISRLTKRDGFSALKPLTNYCIRYFQPSSDTVAEGQRLERQFALVVSRKENVGVFGPRDYNTLISSVPIVGGAQVVQAKRKRSVLDLMVKDPSTTVAASTRTKRSLLDVMEECASESPSKPTQSSRKEMDSWISATPTDPKETWMSPSGAIQTSMAAMTLRSPAPIPRSKGKAKRRILPDLSSEKERLEFVAKARELDFNLDSLMSRNAWIGEDVINLFMQSLVQFQPSFVFVDSHFYESMVKDPSLQQAVRILRRTSYDKQTCRLIFPIFVPGHWMLGIVDFATKTCGYYDSMHFHRPNVLSTLLAFVKALNTEYGEFNGIEIHGPRQLNTFDCGVFVCVAAKKYVENLGIGVFEHNDMPAWRLHILSRISHCLAKP